MDEVTKALGERAVSTLSWTWISGMLGEFLDTGERVRFGVDEGSFWLGTRDDAMYSRMASDTPVRMIPDLEDPATQALVETHLRRIRNDPNGSMQRINYPPEPPRWLWVNGHHNAQIFRVGGTKAEALVLALEERGK
jgi:hypothetical protein